MDSNQTNAAPAFSTAGVIWLKLAVVYLLIGITMGIAMGAKEDFTLKDVHAHVNLIGWVTLALAGLIYTVFPQAGQHRLAKIHFWLLNLALPVMMIALSFLMLGNRQVIPVLAVSEFVAAGGIIAFAINIFTNLKRA
ncbi:MAG: cytochrome-c oxidase [Burkholderiales bacterium]|nr:cytochrome-c oxidase [Burkholderiales bacterium]